MGIRVDPTRGDDECHGRRTTQAEDTAGPCVRTATAVAAAAHEVVRRGGGGRRRNNCVVVVVVYEAGGKKFMVPNQ